ncbi:ATP-binding cassette domain-containing protein [Acuticoccus sp. I52.16.1]|uniref:ATP-binding cassette domain-containing protein n=1 Tax=Acuticoccus sp. I52.16.1 TaxID=2928472 RepID=UPI001FD05E9A|nr:ATP-binding cassette domain-containing protein [Acuticoccus sp. I52.16.1]UOM35630.1 ATP-binding cassette domain-containing protein [Acuticoccus sp. I52.16.1]
MTSAAPLLALEGVGKRYGAVEALSGVSFAVGAGETLAICGDNGAGKSTLIRIVSGAQPPSAGTIRLGGAPVTFASPADALAQGVATIYQDLALAPTMTIAQNVFLGSELRRRVLPGLYVLDKRRMAREAAAHLARLRLAVPDMGRRVADLSGGQRQAVAIARALRWQARIVIMDEPTAALGVRETRLVLSLIKEIAAQGITVILISHNMADVVEVAERALVLKAGRLVRDTPLDGWTADDLSHVIMSHETAAA